MGLILITDDAAFSRRMIRKAVQQTNHEIVEAANGLECLEVIANQSPDCILLDLLMPELDGLGVLKSLREKGSKIPVIVLSADIQESVTQECLDLGAAIILRKPPKAPEIIDALEKAIGNK